MPVTTDGHSVRLYANIALPEDMPDARKAGANGIGLFPNRISISESRLHCRTRRAGIGLSEVIRGMRGKNRDHPHS